MPADPVAGQPPICLVVSTGRCGSTLLSNIARAHPAVLSVSELFSSVRDHDFGDRELSSAQFWDMLSTPSQADVVMWRCQIRAEEMIYPVLPRPGAARFDEASIVPPLLQVTLPHLTQRPDDLYTALGDMTVKQPERSLSGHLRWLFGALAGERRPAVVVERSGGSLAYVSALMRLFPQARVVHVFRDGRECAVSMSKHARYKMAIIRSALRARLGYDPYSAVGAAGAAEREGGRAEPVGLARDEALSGLTPDRFTRAGYDRYEVPLSRYGVMWSKMVADGLAELPDRSRLMTIDYADLVARPRDSIGRFLEFLGVERDAGWERRAAAGIRPGGDVHGEIGGQRWDELTRACRLGMNFLYGRGRWT